MTVRLTPQTTDPSGTDALQARLHDPLWLLGQQWRFGELQAADAGTPAAVTATVEVAPLTAVVTPGSRTPYDPGRAPVEAVVNTAPASTVGWGLAAQAGLHFLRCCEEQGVGTVRDAYVARYPLPPVPADELAALGDSGRRRTLLLAGRVPDGRLLLADLVAGTPSPDLPATVDRAALTGAVRAWRRWVDAGGMSPPTPGRAWAADRLEHRFELRAAASPSGEPALPAPEHRGGRLDWWSMRRGALAPTVPPGSSEPAPAPQTRQISAIPAPVAFRGMPAARHWEFEDGRVGWGALRADQLGPAELVVLEFALTHSGDWFTMPMDLPSGCLARVTSLVVSDSFGERRQIRHVGALDGPNGPWRMFALSTMSGTTGPAVPDDVLLVAPATAGDLDGDPVEEVLLFRDEMANLAWAVERLVQAPLGPPRDRYEETIAAAAANPPLAPAAAGTYRWRLGTAVPPNWFPLVPDGGGLLHPATVPRDAPVAPAALVLTGLAAVRDEEVPREGVRVVRRPRRVRGPDGSTWTWTEVTRAAGRGEGASGLRFDVLDGVD